MPNEPTFFHNGHFLTAAQYTAATGRPAPRVPQPRRTPPTATAKPRTASAESIAAEERSRISQILALPAAKGNRVGAEGIAFGSTATVAEAATALARAADKKALARAAAKDQMRAACGLPPLNPEPLTASAKSMLKTAAACGSPDERRAAIAKLAAHGFDAKGR